MCASFGPTRLAERVIRSFPVNRWNDDRSRPRISARFAGPGSKAIKSSSPMMSWLSASRISSRGLKRMALAVDDAATGAISSTDVSRGAAAAAAVAGLGAAEQPASAALPNLTTFPDRAAGDAVAAAGAMCATLPAPTPQPFGVQVLAACPCRLFGKLNLPLHYTETKFVQRSHRVLGGCLRPSARSSSRTRKATHYIYI